MRFFNFSICTLESIYCIKTLKIKLNTKIQHYKIRLSKLDHIH